MTKTERIAALEAKVAALESRVQATEAAAFRRLLPVYPAPYTPPYPYWTYPGGWGVVTSGATGTIYTGNTSAIDHNLGSFTLSSGTNVVQQ